MRFTGRAGHNYRDDGALMTPLTCSVMHALAANLAGINIRELID